ncbi:MAG: hypothetical protein ACRD1F_01730 [Terriglobales bacterium]
MPAVLKSEAGQYIVLGLVALVIVYYIGKKLTGAAGAVASSAGGLLSGNNALTQGTDYQGAGVAGTLGAATNAVSGGVLSNIGDAIGNKLADWFQSSPTVATPAEDTGAGAQAVNRDQISASNFDQTPDISATGLVAGGM